MLRSFRILAALTFCTLAFASFAVAGTQEAQSASVPSILPHPCSGIVDVECQHTHCDQFGCNTFTCAQYVGLGSNHPGLGSCTHF
jgi:hypothetical protein